MRGKGHSDGVRLRGFAGIGIRSLRARPLRSGLTAAGIALGVGMVFGVLILVTTIHSSFSNLFDAIYGNTTLVVSGKSFVGSVPADTLPKVQRVEGVKSAVGSVSGVFRVVDDSGEARSGRDATLFVSGVDFSAPDPTGSEMVSGREPKTPREIQLEAGWADQEGLEAGDQGSDRPGSEPPRQSGDRPADRNHRHVHAQGRGAQPRRGGRRAGRLAAAGLRPRRVNEHAQRSRCCAS